MLQADGSPLALSIPLVLRVDPSPLKLPRYVVAALQRGPILLACERLPLDLELSDATLDLVDLLRHRIDLDPEA